jgi:hypothetical protein
MTDETLPAQPATPDEAAPEEPRRAGRPSAYTPELGLLIAQRLAAGEPLKTICWDGGIPAESTVRGWALDDEHPFSALYARARAVGFHTIADEIILISDDASRDWEVRRNANGEPYTALNSDAVARSRLMVDSRKWMLSKMLPKLYGDKLEVSGDQANPIQTVNRIEVTIVDPKMQERPTKTEDR